MGHPGVGSVLTSRQSIRLFPHRAFPHPHNRHHKTSCRSPFQAAATLPCSAWKATICAHGHLWVIIPGVGVLSIPLLTIFCFQFASPVQAPSLGWQSLYLRDQTQTSLPAPLLFTRDSWSSTSSCLENHQSGLGKAEPQEVIEKALALGGRV